MSAPPAEGSCVTWVNEAKTAYSIPTAQGPEAVTYGGYALDKAPVLHGAAARTLARDRAYFPARPG